MRLPPPVLEQAHVRLAADYAKLREKYDLLVTAQTRLAEMWGESEHEWKATIETQQVTMEALTAILGAMRDNERMLRGQIAALTAENNDLAAKLLEAGQELARRKGDWEELRLQVTRPIWETPTIPASGGYAWTKDPVWKYAKDDGGLDSAPHKWDLRSRG